MTNFLFNLEAKFKIKVSSENNMMKNYVMTIRIKKTINAWVCFC